MRADLELMSRWIEPNAALLDLGCGDGVLLDTLTRDRGVVGFGVEIDPELVADCIERGLNVIHQDLDDGLADFGDAAFDYVVMTQALQAVPHPHRLLRDMVRVGREAIITFPNFGHWRTRWALAIGGRMPITETLPHPWYSTPNVRLCTVRDFEELCAIEHVSILERVMVDQRHRSNAMMQRLPNLLGEIAVYRVAAQ
ncbi:methionine biosynthesis protein MetW [uncultured Abyssibacter sp.]|uniref:methionine biosynthesis protein MetW n=1 Tax=uncultured Abyssibacter sp. TaxID=2320202 RepID=UPI0032B264BA